MVQVSCHKKVVDRPSHLFSGPSTFEALLKLLALLSLTVSSTGFQPRAGNSLPTIFRRCRRSRFCYPLLLSSDDWASFQSLDDDDEIVYGKLLDKQEYAEENDPQYVKEAVGSLRGAPVIEREAEPILVPAG
jgi:hypothetical protein